MANLTVRIGDELTYSDGTYLPSEGVTELNNPKLILSVPFDAGEIVLRCVADTKNGALYTFPDDDELQKYSSSYSVTSDSEWVSLVRERNITRILLEPNYDTYDRSADIIIKHNTGKEVYCEVNITQYGDVYVLETLQSDFNFPIEAYESTVRVICSGGTGKYSVRDIRKYTRFMYKDDESDEEPDIIVKRVNFDNALSATIDSDNPDSLIINSHGSLSLDDSYYEIILEHNDMIGLTATVRVTFEEPSGIDIPNIPDEGTYTCDDEPLMPQPQINQPDVEETPAVIINERYTDIWIDSSDYFGEIIVETVPMESKIYFIYYGDIIGDYIITDYESDDGTIFHGLKIKAKPNPYNSERNCIGYVINAMYPSVKQRIYIHQEANS